MNLLPQPNELEPRPGRYSFGQAPKVHSPDPSPYLPAIIGELRARESDAAHADIRLAPAGEAPGEWARHADAKEGYVLEIAEEGVVIYAVEPEGHLYGAMTLRQLADDAKAVSSGSISCTIIGDAPALSRRGVQLSFPQGHTAYRWEYMKRLVPQLARWKINELYLYLESFFDFPSLPHFAGPGAMTSDQAVELDRLCTAYNIRLVPMLNTLAHCGELLATQKYNHLTEYPDGTDRRVARPFNLCSTSKETEALVDGMLDDLMACFSSEVLHIGGDEVSSIGECPRCASAGVDSFHLYKNYYTRILENLGKNGRHGGIWGDMLLHYGRDAYETDGLDLIRLFPENTVIYDWHYSGGSRESLELFVGAGLPTIACSSTHLCYTSAMYPAQAENQRLLFSDAAAAGAQGGMTTAWCNFTGLHEEQYNYLHASGAAMLWSGPEDGNLANGLSVGDFETSYSFHRYGLRSAVLTEYLHAVGDLDGPVLGPLQPQHGVNPRKCIYHTTNVLDFWMEYCGILGESTFGKYKDGVAAARSQWQRVATDADTTSYPYLHFLEAPLLMHEHLIRRFELTEAAYGHYDLAAAAQFSDEAVFREELSRSAQSFLSHLEDFAPVEDYINAAHKKLGLDKASLHRLQATKQGINELAALLEHFETAGRPLPAFQQLHGVFLEPFRTNWYGDREHDWSAGPARFRRFSLKEPGVWGAVPRIDAEG